jgi:hypothetical protein
MQSYYDNERKTFIHVFFYIDAMATMTTNAIENGSYDNGSSSITLRFRNGILKVTP